MDEMFKNMVILIEGLAKENTAQQDAIEDLTRRLVMMEEYLKAKAETKDCFEEESL